VAGNRLFVRHPEGINYMKLITALTSFSFVIGCLLTQPAWSDYELVDANGVVLTMSITKSIKETDYTDIVNEVKSYETYKTIKKLSSSSVYHFILDSPGGNVSVSLKIGRFLRKLHAAADIKQNAVCLSSCVYILAGAVRRNVSGSVGIHRPYEPNDEVTTAAGQKQKYTKIGKQIEQYLKEINVSTRLYEDSLFISPNKIKILSSNEMQTYGLNVDDPYYEEALDSSTAKYYGVSKKEYMERGPLANKECGIDGSIDNQPDSEQIAKMNCKEKVIGGKR